MLQNVRDNMKSTVFVIVVIIFIVPMVMSGVGSSFLGTVAGTEAANVDGRDISNTELRRAVYMQKQRILSQQGVDPSADFLKDENLRGPVLDRLTRRTAMLVASENGGMAVSDKTIGDQISRQEDFFVDGKFDEQRYRSLLANLGYTPATFKSSMGDDLLLAQNAKGMQSSGFVTKGELDAIIGIVQQRRSFVSIKIPADKAAADTITVDDSEIQTYYDNNQSSYVEEEKMSVEYIELSVDELAKGIDVSDEDIQAQFDQELAEFDTSPEYKVAHLLIEEKEDESHLKLIEDIASKINADNFAELVKEHSDDAGSKALGGELGTVAKGVFPEEFEQAVFALEANEISAPVVTDSGTHFIKILEKNVPNAPKFEDRKAAIQLALQRGAAEDSFIDLSEQLADTTYGADELVSAAETLGLELKTSELFGRETGTGIATNSAVRAAAYEPEVLNDGVNSQVIEIGADKAIVVRKKEHKPEHVKELALVKEEIVALLTKEKKDALLAEKADAVIAVINAGEDAKAFADKEGYTFASHDQVKRSDVAVGYELLRHAFAIPQLEGGQSYQSVSSNDGGYFVIVLTDVIAGSATDMPEAQLRGLLAQLERENTTYETSTYEAKILENANIKLY